MVLDAVEREATARDAVAVASDERADVEGLTLIVLDTIEAEHNVIEMSAAVGNLERDDRAAVCGDARLRAPSVGERVDVHVLPRSRPPEAVPLHTDFAL